MKNNNQLLILLFIFLIPIFSNSIYLTCIKYIPFFEINLVDSHYYLMNILYTYPEIPPDTNIDIITQIGLKGGYASLFDKYGGRYITFDKLDVNDLVDGNRSKMKVAKLLKINLYLNSCNAVSETEAQDIATQIKGSSLYAWNRFPDFATNFFQIQLNYSEDKVSDFVKTNCNLPEGFKYEINFDPESKYL